MIDISIFKPLLEKATYDKYKGVIFSIPSMEAETKVILSTIKDYYSHYPEKDSITVDELKLHFTNSNPVIKTPDTYQKLLDRLYSADISNVELLIDSINRLAETATASLIMADCLELVNNYRPGSLPGITKHLEYYDKLTSNLNTAEAAVCNMTLEELIRMDSVVNGVNWELPFLQDAVGPLKPGTLGHIFAYSETGKTSLGIFELVHYAQKLVEPDCALYLGNEEPVYRTKLRAYSALMNRDKDTIITNRSKAEEIWKARIGSKLKFIDDVRHISQVEQYIQDFKPALVMIDQGPKVSIPGESNDVKKLQELYNRYRQLAVNNSLAIITLGQAESACSGRKWLQLNHMDMSKVGIPGELDLAIGIGRSDDEGMENNRYLSVCKNKLTGKHGQGFVIFDYKTCNFKQGGK